MDTGTTAQGFTTGAQGFATGAAVGATVGATVCGAQGFPTTVVLTGAQGFPTSSRAMCGDGDGEPASTIRCAGIDGVGAKSPRALTTKAKVKVPTSIAIAFGRWGRNVQGENLTG